MTVRSLFGLAVALVWLAAGAIASLTTESGRLLASVPVSEETAIADRAPRDHGTGRRSPGWEPRTQ